MDARATASGRSMRSATSSFHPSATNNNAPTQPRKKAMSLKFTAGDLTIQRIIEQETTFLPALEMLPGLTPDVLAENRTLMRQGGAIGKDDAVFSGDLMHSPLQTRYSELSVKFDVDAVQAAATRRERYCDTETLCCTAHFPSPTAGKIHRRGDGFSCEAVAGRTLVREFATRVWHARCHLSHRERCGTWLAAPIQRFQSNKFGVWFTTAPSIASIFSFVTTPPLAEKPPGLPPAASTRWQGTTIGHGLRPSAWPTSRDSSTPPSFLAISP